MRHRKLLIKSGHSVGKTHFAAMMTNWFFDTFDPSLTMTTAPSKRDVEDLLWKEVRMQRLRAGLQDDFIGPAAPEMKTSPDHYAKGYTASKGESFQGRHDENMFFIFDEALGVEATYWNTTKTMFKRDQNHYWLCIFNPTDTTSQAYQEEQDGDWDVMTLSCLDHPNIALELEGERPIIPSAVTMSQIDGWINDWCIEVSEEERVATDIEWRGVIYRPGPDFEARAMGVWPSQDSHAVWSDALWNRVVEMEAPPPPIDLLPEIGLDAAREGSDRTDWHVRWGCRSLFHESVNAWKETAICGRVIELAREWTGRINEERTRRGMALLSYQDVPIKIDDDGTGGAIGAMLMEEDMTAIQIRGGKNATYVERYPNKRSELWFMTVSKAKAGLVSLGKLDRETLQRLRTQAFAPTWRLDRAGRREVEPKKATRDRLNGKSPDGMDALNLAYYEAAWDPPTTLSPKRAEENRGEHEYVGAASGAYDRINAGRRMKSSGIGSRLFRR